MVDVPGTDDRELDGLALEALAEAYATSPPSALRDRMLGAARQETALQRALRARGAWRLVGMVAAGSRRLTKSLYIEPPHTLPLLSATTS